MRGEMMVKSFMRASAIVALVLVPVVHASAALQPDDVPSCSAPQELQKIALEMELKVLKNKPYAAHGNSNPWSFMTEDKVITGFKGNCDLSIEIANFIAENKLNPKWTFTIFAAYKYKLILERMMPHYKRDDSDGGHITSSARDTYFDAPMRQTLNEDTMLLSHPPSIYKAMKLDLQHMGLKWKDTNLFVARSRMGDVYRAFKFKSGNYEKCYAMMNELYQNEILANIKLGATVMEDGTGVPEENWLAAYQVGIAAEDDE